MSDRVVVVSCSGAHVAAPLCFPELLLLFKAKFVLPAAILEVLLLM